MSTVVISVRVKRRVKELLEEEGVNIGEEVKRYLEELAYKILAKRYVEKWNRLLNNVRPSEKGFSSRSVREDRESH